MIIWKENLAKWTLKELVTHPKCSEECSTLKKNSKNNDVVMDEDAHM